MISSCLNLEIVFSDAPTMKQTREELRNMRQKDNESFIVYAYQWGRALVRSSGIHPENESHPHVIKDFISSLQRNIRNKIANKWAEMRNPPRTVQEAFDLADRIESQVQVADSFKLELSSDFFPVEINEVSTEETSGDEFEVNEVSRNGKWGCKNGNYGYNKNYSSKPCYNGRSQENKWGKKWDQKEKDFKITLTQESSHFIPAKFSDLFFIQFNLAMMLKRDELKNKGKVETMVSEITKEELVEAFGIMKDPMVRPAEILTKDENTKKLRNLSAWLAKGYEPENYQSSEKEVMFIQQGDTKGMTFKIKVNNLVFASLFDTGAQVSCIKYDTASALGLLHKISDSKVNVRTANGHNTGIKGSVMVSFKIESCSFTHKFIVCEVLNRPFILGEEFLSHHCFTLGWTDNNKRFAQYKGNIIAVASQAVMDDRIMVAHPVRIPTRNFTMVPTKCSNMFSGTVKAHPCLEF